MYVFCSIVQCDFKIIDFVSFNFAVDQNMSRRRQIQLSL